VLQIVPRLVSGGVERGTVEVTAALTAAGWRAYVASAGGPMVEEVERAGGVHLTLPVAAKNPLVMWRNVARIEAEIRRHRIDIVHARSRAPAWSAWAAARRGNGAHFVTTFHNAYGAGNALRRLYNSAMAKGERVIAISDFVADYARRIYGMEPERLRVIPRGVDVARFDPANVAPERVERLAAEWRLPRERGRIVLLPGRLTRWKGQLDLIEAAARLASRTDLLFLLVGSGAERPEYKREIEEAIARHRLGDRVRLLPACRDMPAAFLLADLVVSASTRPEGFGRVIVEAQAMGRPVVATDHGGARETVIPGETGWLAPPGDVPALAAAIEAALDRPAEARTALAERAIEHVRRHFTTELMCARTLAVYRELVPAPAISVDAP
jgi:glycosyltransferase involved in cell wall biosynthesis